MKIELKLTATQLAYIGMSFEALCEDNAPKFGILTRKEKASYTIAQDIADKLHNKIRAINRKSTKKLIKATFKYHEAFAINYLTQKDKDFHTDPYLKAVAQNIYSQLDPKL